MPIWKHVIASVGDSEKVMITFCALYQFIPSFADADGGFWGFVLAIIGVLVTAFTSTIKAISHVKKEKAELMMSLEKHRLEMTTKAKMLEIEIEERKAAISAQKTKIHGPEQHRKES